jgi:hypothetical protein
MAWIYVATTIILTVYGQPVVKWQVLRHGALPASLRGKGEFFVHLLVNPWVISGWRRRSWQRFPGWQQ